MRDWECRVAAALRQESGHEASGAAAEGGFRSLVTPVYRGATVVFPDAASVREGTRAAKHGYTYGMVGTPTTEALARRVCAMEGGAGTVLTPSGQAAIALVNLALLKAGDHVLLPQSAYGPNQRMAREMLRGLGVETECYDPLVGEGIAALLRPNTTLVWVESPGSITMEVQDVPAIVRAVHARGAKVAMDNTWASGVMFPALEHGVDVSIQALTKYVAGHSDLLLGSATAREEAVLERLGWARGVLGMAVSPDDCSLALRGLGTMAVRLRAVEAAGLAVAQWLGGRAEVERVLHPALEGCPGHALWQRDFSGSCGLFSFVFREGTTFAATRSFVDSLTMFRQGFSWGGVESLALNYDLTRSEGDRAGYGWRVVRLHVGLEPVGDLVGCLEQGFVEM